MKVRLSPSNPTATCRPLEPGAHPPLARLPASLSLRRDSLPCPLEPAKLRPPSDPGLRHGSLPSAQSRRGSSFTIEGRPAGPRNLSLGTGSGNRSEAKLGGTGWSRAPPRRRVNHLSPGALVALPADARSGEE